MYLTVVQLVMSVFEREIPGTCSFRMEDEDVFILQPCTCKRNQ